MPTLQQLLALVEALDGAFATEKAAIATKNMRIAAFRKLAQDLQDASTAFNAAETDYHNARDARRAAQVALATAGGLPAVEAAIDAAG